MSTLRLTLVVHLLYWSKQINQLSSTTSALAFVPSPRNFNYDASKAAMHAFLLVIRAQLRELHPGIKIVELIPPAVQSEPPLQSKSREQRESGC